MKNLFKSMAIALSISLLGPLTLQANAAQTAAPMIVGESAVVMDIATGEVIYSKNAEVPHSPASTTKLMTSLLFAENKQKSDMIAFTPNVLKVTETSLSGFKAIKPGDKMSANDVMKSVMIFSANDAAYLMAESTGGTVENFVGMMNKKASDLGLKNTHFVNPCGLETDPLNPSNTEINKTTAYDLAIIGKEAYKNEWVKEAMATSGQTTVSLAGTPIMFEPRNKVLGKNGNVGGKTGTEDQAGHCFVGFYEENGRELVSVVLKSEYGADGLNVFHDTEDIIDYSYAAEKEVYKKAGEEVGTTELSYKVFKFFGPTKTVTAPIVLTEDAQYYKNDFNDKNTKVEYTPDEKDAWSIAGNDDLTLSLTSLQSKQDIKGKVNLSNWDLIKANLPIYLAALLISVVTIVLVFLLVKLINMRKNRSRRRRY